MGVVAGALPLDRSGGMVATRVPKACECKECILAIVVAGQDRELPRIR